MFHGTLQPHWSLPNIDQVNQGRVRVRILQLQQVNGFPPLFKLQLIFDQVGIQLFLSKKRKLETEKKRGMNTSRKHLIALANNVYVYFQ